MDEGWVFVAVIMVAIFIICGTSTLNTYLDYRTAIVKSEAETRKAQADSNARIQASIEETKRWELTVSRLSRKAGD